MLYQEIKTILNRNSATLKKRYGQNFCTDEQVLDDIVEAAGISKKDNIIEIGPGIGALTVRLAAKANSVTAVEIDKEMVDILNKEIGDIQNITIINEDIMKWNGIADKPKPLKIVANLPYYITTPILVRLLSLKENIDCITVMVQKEVAERMCAKPANKAYGALTLLIKYHTQARLTRIVSKECFLPAPKVDSAVVNMIIRKEPAVRVNDEEALFKLIRAAFSQRRKTLLNSLSNQNIFGLNKSQIESAIRECGLDTTIRAERLSLNDFAELLDNLIAARL